MIFAALGNIVGTLLVARLEIRLRAIGFILQCIANSFWTYTYLFTDFNLDMAITFGSFLVIALYGLFVIRTALFSSLHIINKYGNAMYVDKKE